MDVGLIIGNLNLPVGREAITEASVLADQIGFKSLWMADHTIMPIKDDWQTNDRYTYDLYDPFVTAGYVAALTKKAKLGFGVIVLPYRNPVIQAKMFATLDQLSQGRVILGIGPGYLPDEYRALGIPLKNTGDKTNEYIDAFRTLWASEAPVFHGKYINVENMHFKPRPYNGTIPIWVGGMSEAALQRAVRQGDGWYVPRMSLIGIKPYIDRIHEIAAEQGRDLSNFTFSNRLTIRFADKPEFELPPHLQRPVQARVTPETTPIIGPAEYIAEEMVKFQTQFNVTHMSCGIHEGDPLPDHLRAIERFGKEVLPLIPGALD